MRKLFVILMAVCVLAGFAVAGNKPFFFPFIGKWQPAEDPLHIDDYGFQDIQNLRKDGKRLKGVGGHTTINTAAWNATYSYPKSGFHFKKARPSESHVIIYATDSAGAGGRLYQNTTAIPSTGDFIVTSLHTDAATGAGLGRFSNAPQGQMIYCNGAESLLWGGDEISPLALITSTADVVNEATNPTDYTEAVSNESSDRRDLAIIGGGIDTNTKLMLHCDGADAGVTFTDDGDTTHVITAVGNAQTDTAFKKFGTASGLFDGTGDYIWAADHADFNYAGGALTLETWIRFNAVTGQQCFYSQAITTGYISLMQDHDAGKLYLAVMTANTRNILESATWAPAVNIEYHVAVIRGWDGNANDWAITVDGTAIATFTANITMPDLAPIVEIGNMSDTVLIDFGNTGHGFTLANSATLSAGAAKWGTGSFYVDGTGDEGVSVDSAEWDLVASAADTWTIDLWVKHSDYAGTETYIGQAVDGNNFWSFGHTDGTGLTFYLYDTAVPTITVTGGEIDDSNWHHVALVKVADEYGLYLDGVQTGYVQDNSTYNMVAGLYLGSISSLNEFEGYLSEIRIIKSNPFGAVPNNVPDNTITVPTSAHTSDADTKLLLHCNMLDFNGWLDEFRITKGAARWIADFTTSLRAYRDDARYWLVGAQQPLEGVKYYVETPNSVASILTAREWDGGGWTSLTIADGTDTGASLARTGKVTWTLTGNAEKRFLEDYSLYWYLFYLDAGDAEIYQVTIDAPIDDIPNIWDGSEIPIAGCKFWDNSDGEFDDYTDLVQSTVVTDVADLSSAEVADYLLVGFTEPVQAMHIYIPAGKGNANASVMTVAYWAGSAWSTAPNLNDGTDEGGDTLSTNGYVSYNPPGESEEFERTIKGETPLYWYKISWSGAIAATTEIYLIKGVSNPTEIANYKFSALFQNRSFLFADMDGLRNRAIYSAENAPYIYNGDDSGYLDFGAGDEELTAAGTIYNVFLSTGYEQLIVCKNNETYRVFGDGPTNWDVDQISGNIGCVAPLSMAICEIADVSEDTKRHVVIWQGDKGVYMCDGATVQPISGDIRNYWDHNSSDYIPVNRQDDSIGWYDPDLQSYKLLISSGSGQTIHNVELEYSLKYQEWTKILREDANRCQDTADFTEHDVKGTGIALTDATTVTVTGIDHDEESYVIQDMGAGYFDGDFEIHTHINTDTITSPGEVFVWAVSNTDDTMGAIDTASGDYLGIYYNAYYLWLERCDGGVLTAHQITTVLSHDTDYYLKIIRDESVGANGTLYCYVYSDEAMQTLVDSGSLALGDMDDFQYLYWMSGSERGVGGSAWSGTIGDLLIITGNENPLQIGFQVRDTNGETYTYGATDDGQMYRLENGNDWDGADITQYVHTKDMLLDDGPFQMVTQTVVDYFQIIYERKSAGDVSVIHYCNTATVQTVDGADYQAVPDAIDMDSDGDGYHGNSSIQDCTLGPCLLHSFKLQSDQNVADGMELLGMGLIHDPMGTITE